MSDNTEHSPAESILAHQKRIDDVNDDGFAGPRNALEYVQDVYKGRRQVDPWRFRAAVAALPFESPKLSATTIVNREDFAVMLDRATQRSRAVADFKPIGYVSVEPATDEQS